jgi:asparagine synthase (glutamine-hydrolysing)
VSIIGCVPVPSSAAEDGLVQCYRPGDPPQALACDLAGERPVYVHLARDCSRALVGTDLKALLDDPRLSRPLVIDREGVAFLLQSGVVPPPRTAIEGLFVLGIGQSARLATRDGAVEIGFGCDFPFRHADRLPPEAAEPPRDEAILERLAAAIADRRRPGRGAVLFHSAGKDSNTLALAIAAAGWQDEVTFASLRSTGSADESAISAGIAARLGARHVVLEEAGRLDAAATATIERHFVEALLPCTDNVALSYPLYGQQQPALLEADLIDGLGGDVYLGHVPSQRQRQRMRMSGTMSVLLAPGSRAASTSLLHVAGRSRAEWCGLSGFSHQETAALLPDAADARAHWRRCSRALRHLDDFDFLSRVKGGIISPEVNARKLQNFADATGAAAIFPWKNEEVARYFWRMPEAHLLDRVRLRDKIVLRAMLYSRLGLDCDAIGKRGFTYNTPRLVRENAAWLRAEIAACPLWAAGPADRLAARLQARSTGRGWGAAAAAKRLYRLFLIAMWATRSRHLRA